MIHLFEGARRGGVPIFDIESTRKTNIPIVVAFINVRVVGVPDLSCSHGDGQVERDNSASVWDNLALHAHTGATICLLIVRKRGMSTASTTGPTPATWALSAPPGAEIPGGKLLLERDRELLDQGYVGDGSVPSCRIGGGRRE
jgi:hypothetical protein